MVVRWLKRRRVVPRAVCAKPSKANNKFMRIKELFFILLLLSIDVISKVLITANLIKGSPLNLINGLLWVELAENKGFAFGLGGSLSFFLIFLYLLAIVILITILVRPERKKSERLGYTLLLSGVLGNTLDRLVDGKVTDFIALKGFAIFNFADIFITTGLLVILLLQLSKSRETQDS